VPIEGAVSVVPCDAVIAAISQSPDLGFLPENHQLELTRWNTIVADEKTLATSMEGVFAGGDAFTGPASVIDAIRDGHKAAAAIHSFLRDEPMPEMLQRAYRPGDYEIARNPEDVERRERIHSHHADPEHRKKSFEEVARGFTEEEVIAEASRCLHCGPCEECDICVTCCDRKLFVAKGPGEEDEEVFLRLPMDSPAYQKAQEHLDAMLAGQGEPAHEEQRVKLEPVTSYVLEELCRGCGDCTEACEYDVAKLIEKDNGRLVSSIDEELCRGCGTCAAICPSGAIVARHFTDEWVHTKLKKALLG
jgi:heterodisulfide reductase subunit A-like polyferredoxin